MNNFTISSSGLDAIKGFEGFYPKAYLCPAGVPTIGYGHTQSVSKNDVKIGRTITKAEAEKLLRQDLSWAEKAVKKAVKVKLTQGQFDALVSFTFNVGAGAFGRSTLLKKLNKGDYKAVPTELARWNRGGGRVLAGLVKRRAIEGEMWGIKGNMPQIVDEPINKPLTKSRTLAGIATAATGEAVQQAAQEISFIGDMLNIEHLKIAGSALIILGLSFAAYARFDDWQKGRK